MIRWTDDRSPEFRSPLDYCIFFISNEPTSSSQSSRISANFAIIRDAFPEFSSKNKVNVRMSRRSPLRTPCFSAGSKQRVARSVALLFFEFHLSSAREKRGRGGGGGQRIAAFTSDKIPANLSTLQPQRQNSSVEIGDRGVGYRRGGRGRTVNTGNRGWWVDS